MFVLYKKRINIYNTGYGHLEVNQFDLKFFQLDIIKLQEKVI